MIQKEREKERKNNREKKNSGMAGLGKKVIMFLDSKKKEGSMNHKNEDSFYKLAKSRSQFPEM